MPRSAVTALRPLEHDARSLICWRGSTVGLRERLNTPDRFCWLAFDDGDKDLAHFLSHHTTAIHTRRPQVNVGLLALPSPQIVRHDLIDEVLSQQPAEVRCSPSLYFAQRLILRQ